MIISKKRLSDVFSAGVEGGIQHWGEITKVVAPKGFVRTDETVGYIDCPLLKGGSIEIADVETGEKWELNLTKLWKGIKVLSAKYPHHAKLIRDEAEDAGTGDALVQCALFGEIVFG